jgi:NAD(P)-dependent dehydrogenase (short-subunit alcohol dehydrogenase family)
MDVQYNLTGMRALVTGGGTGIGKGCASELMRAGADITIAGPEKEVLEHAEEELRQSNKDQGTVSHVLCDVTDEEQVREAIEFAAKGENLDIALANAGTGFPPGPIIALTADQWKPSYEVNVIGTAMTIKHAALTMRKHGGGSIIAISSTTSQRAAPFMAPYCATKAGVDQLVQCAAVELGRFNVRVNAIRPGFTATPHFVDVISDEFKANYIQKTPLGRAGNPEDIAKTVLFLASSQSEWVTGQVFCACGGFGINQGENFEEIARMVHGDEVIDDALNI